MSPPTDFESAASTNSATGARRRIIATHGGGSTGAPYDAMERPSRWAACTRVRSRKVAWLVKRARATRRPDNLTGNEPMSERIGERLPASETWATLVRTRPIAAAAVAIAAGGMATILGAWFFQYVIGLKPCPLCYEQRYAYYFAIPTAALVILG